MKKMYCLIVTDDYSMFSWVFFLATKDETSGILKSFITGVENLIDQRVKVIRCDNRTEFENKEMNQFYERKGIKREFSVARTPQQNRAEAVNTACYVQNRVLVTKPHNKTPYELFLGRKPALGFMRPFRCPVTILNTRDHLGTKACDDADDYEDVGAEADMNNLNTFMPASPIPSTRIHKDHPVEQIIRDLNSAPQTRRMTKNLEEHEWINYDEVFDPIARIEAIRLFLAYASFKDFVVYQMDVKSAFLYGKIKEEVYVCQPAGFEDPNFPDRVYKVEKELYGLHQAPKAWYETLSTYLLDNGFHRGKINKTLFIRRDKGDILLVQVYVYDIIFGFTKKSSCTEFEKMMHKKFQISSMGELTFFLGLQVNQKEDGIFISQDKYVTEILKKFGFSNVKTASTPMETQKPLLKDKDGEEVDVHLYRSMFGSLMYLTSLRHGIMFVIDFMAMQEVANSTIEVKYVAAPSCCGQVLWIQNQLLDYRKQKSRRPKEKNTEIPQSSVPSDPTNIADEAVTKEPSMQLKELMDFYTKLQQRVLDLENTNTAQAKEITSLKKRVKRLEKKRGSRTHKLKRLYKIGRSARVVSSDEASLGDQEDASKQGRKINDIDADAEITLVDETQGRHDDDLMFDTGVLNDEEVFAGQDMTKKEVSTTDPVTTAGEVVTTANVEVSSASPTAATITNVELTLAQTLAELKSARPKTNGLLCKS
ncbi:putative ribonuclease H-like domain-containing protein [Tanacetum coccineum]